MRIHNVYNEEESYARALPTRSLLRLRLPTDNSAKIRGFQTFQLPELLMAGYRQSLMPAQCVRMLYQRGAEALFNTAVGELDPSKAATQIDDYIGAAESLRDHWWPVAVSVDRFFVTKMINEDGYLEQMAAVFGAMHPNADRSAIFKDLIDLATSLTPTVPNQRVFDQLTDLYETHGRVVAETVADVALNVPYQLGPKEVSVECYSPVNRLETVVGTLARIDSVDNRPSDELRNYLRQQVDDTVEIDTPDVELLSVPVSRTDPTRFPTPDVEQVPVSAAAKDQTIARAFRQAGFGGVVYECDAGTDRLINPFVASQDIAGTTYEAYWQRAYFEAELLDTLRDRTDPERAIDCPLCRISVDRCGGDNCGCRSLLNPITDVTGPLIRETKK